MRSLASTTLAISIIFPLIAVFFAILRLKARRLRSAALQLDDWMIFVTVVLCIALGINSTVAVGLDVIGLDPQSLGMERAVALEKIIYGDAFLGFTALATVKIAVLAFYKRLFVTPTFRIASTIMMLVIGAWWIASLLCLLLDYDPIESNWEPLLPHQDRLNFRVFLLAHASLDLFFDITILCFPLPIIQKLHMKTSKKVGLVGIFWLGAFCVIAEGVRIYYFDKFFRASTQHYANGVEVPFESAITGILIWTRIEPCVSVMAACLPVLGPLVAGRDASSIIKSVRSALSIRSMDGGISRPSNVGRLDDKNSLKLKSGDSSSAEGSQRDLHISITSDGKYGNITSVETEVELQNHHTEHLAGITVQKAFMAA